MNKDDHVHVRYVGAHRTLSSGHNLVPETVREETCAVDLEGRNDDLKAFIREANAAFFRKRTAEDDDDDEIGYLQEQVDRLVRRVLRNVPVQDRNALRAQLCELLESSDAWGDA